tara:strand:+ start:2848 stop:3354 length:507 start_codon:yes stop_codon:yes gene_type:complete
MAGSNEIRRILNYAVKSLKDNNNVSEDLGFKHTLTKENKPYRLHMTASLSTRNEDIVTLQHLQTYIDTKKNHIENNMISSDATTQTFDMEIPAGFKVATGSLSFQINGLEQHTTEDQKTASDTGIDYYLTGSRFENLVLYKPRADHSGLLVDNQDSLLINYRMEKVVG